MLKGLIKNKKGLTLIEVIVASAISAIVLSAALSIIIPTMKTVQATQDMSDAKNTSSSIINIISEKVKYAKNITIENGSYSPAITTSAVIYQELDSITPNILITNYQAIGNATGTDIVGRGFYGKLSFKVYYTKSSTKADALEINIVVSNKHMTQQIYKTTATVKVLNVQVAGEIKDNTVPPITGLPENYIVYK